MKERIFRFKQFAVRHEAAAMKVGTDGVTLGAWAPCGGRVLDVGCGCGLIGLMAAQRGAASVTMVEIDPAAAEEARANAADSPWSEITETACADFTEFAATGLYDSIICNPPFFTESLHAPDAARAAARHQGSLTPERFMKAAARLLAPGGSISLILPPDRTGDWTFAAQLEGLYPTRLCSLLTKAGNEPRRILLTLSRDNQGATREELAIGSDEYKKLTREFYLNG